MAFYEERAQRARNLPGLAPDLPRLAGILLVFTVAATLVIQAAPSTGTAPALPDWHGNIAASGWSN